MTNKTQTTTGLQTTTQLTTHWNVILVLWSDCNNNIYYRYCSSSCQHNDWDSHKKMCREKRRPFTILSRDSLVERWGGYCGVDKWGGGIFWYFLEIQILHLVNTDNSDIKIDTDNTEYKEDIIELIRISKDTPTDLIETFLPTAVTNFVISQYKT